MADHVLIYEEMKTGFGEPVTLEELWPASDRFLMGLGHCNHYEQWANYFNQADYDGIDVFHLDSNSITVPALIVDCQYCRRDAGWVAKQKTAVRTHLNDESLTVTYIGYDYGTGWQRWVSWSLIDPHSALYQMNMIVVFDDLTNAIQYKLMVG